MDTNELEEEEKVDKNLAFYNKTMEWSLTVLVVVTLLAFFLKVLF